MTVRRLAVLHVDLSRRDGGADRQTAALLAGLTLGGHRVLGIVRRGTPIERRALACGAPVFPLEPRFPLGPGGVLTWWSRGRARLLAARGGWDLLHFADPESYALAGPLLTGASPDGALPPSRVLVTHRGLGGLSARRAPAALRRHHRSGGTIAPASEALWAALVRERFDEDRLCVIHPGIDVKAFAADAGKRMAARCAFGFGEKDEIVGAVAVLDRDRGMEDLLDGAAILMRERAGARLVIVGDGPRRAALEAKSRSLGVAGRVLFTGWREDVAAVVQALDVFVFAGRGEEVFPLSLVEAMAAGVPVVVRDQPGIREIIENGKQGLFVPGTGSDAMARTIFRVFADRPVAQAMGRAGAVRVQRFHTQAMIDATEALYYKLLKATTQGP